MLVQALGPDAGATLTGLDWIIVAFAALLAWFGFRQGFIVGVLSFGGFALGAFVGTRIGPLLLPQGSSSPYAPAFGLVGALVAGAILATGLEGVGLRLRRVLIIPGLGLLDGLLGAVLSVAVGLGIVWIAAAVLAQTPGQTQLRGRHPALARSCGRSTRCCRPRARSWTRSPVSTRCPRSPARRRTSPPRSRRSPRTPAVRGGLAQRRARAGHRLRPCDRGLGLGGGAG